MNTMYTYHTRDSVYTYHHHMSLFADTLAAELIAINHRKTYLLPTDMTSYVSIIISQYITLIFI